MKYYRKDKISVDMDNTPRGAVPRPRAPRPIRGAGSAVTTTTIAAVSTDAAPSNPAIAAYRAPIWRITRRLGVTVQVEKSSSCAVPWDVDNIPGQPVIRGIYVIALKAHWSVKRGFDEKDGTRKQNTNLMRRVVDVQLSFQRGSARSISTKECRVTALRETGDRCRY
jgi:hypothetical protein